jgi:hypothetical protein
VLQLVNIKRVGATLSKGGCYVYPYPFSSERRDNRQGRENSAQVQRPFPIRFWRVSVALSSSDPGDGRVRYVNCPEITMTLANSYHIGCLLALILVATTGSNADLFLAVLS